MDTQVLEDIGLTPREIKIYLSLLESGPSSAGAIIEKARVQNSVFHFCANNLIGKGIVSYTKKGKVKVYKAADPKTLLAYLRNKEKQIQELLPALEEKQALSKEKQEVEMFEGFKGITSAMYSLIENAKRGDEFLFFTLNLKDRNEEVQEFYEKFGIRRVEKGMATRGIAPIELKPILSNRKDMNVRYTSSPTPSNLGLCNDKMILVSWGDKPKAVLIQSKPLVDRQIEFFESYWKSLTK